MSSEHDESAELLHDLSVKSDNEKSESSAPKGAGEHAKPKRRGRRGKRRKQRKDSGAICDSETQEEHEAGQSNTWDSDEELECKINAYNDVIVRPVNVPKAPENSTQFIIDDHNECRLYMSFETPNPYITDAQHMDGEHGEITEPAEDAAFIDIDYEYESPQDFDNSAYYDKEFEESYKNNRFDELLRLPKNELISGLQVLETRLRELSEDLVRENPSPILEKLQAELLELQEKHLELKECNSRLTALLLEREAAQSAPQESPVNAQTPNRDEVPQDGFSPKSEQVSPSFNDGSKGEPMVVAGEDSGMQLQKTFTVWSPTADGEKDERLRGPMAVREVLDNRESQLHEETGGVAGADSLCKNALKEHSLSGVENNAAPHLQLSKSDAPRNCLNSSKDGAHQNSAMDLDCTAEVEKTVFKSDLVSSNQEHCAKKEPNCVASHEELNSLAV